MLQFSRAWLKEVWGRGGAKVGLDKANHRSREMRGWNRVMGTEMEEEAMSD